MRRRYVIIRHSDDTGQEAVAYETHRRDVANRLAADMNRTATFYGAAVTYRVAEEIRSRRKMQKEN